MPRVTINQRPSSVSHPPLSPLTESDCLVRSRCIGLTVRMSMSDRSNPLLGAHQFFRQGPASAEGWSQLVAKDRAWEEFYRDRWQHDKIVRSTHGVNCTGSCSWQIYVKNGIVTWEMQALDYPSLSAGLPPYEPRGCQRGISFSWYLYS